LSTTHDPPALDTPKTSLEVASASASSPRYSARSALERVRPRHAALLCILAFSAVLNTYKLAQNGYANTFYSAAVKSMLGSLHNFLYASFDPGGLITIDKPPLAVWVQVASAKLFGLSPLSLLLPEAIISTIAVAVLYRVIAPRLGAPAALLAALALAVFPSFVAVSRDNGVDPLLILLLILACGAALNAIEGGSWRWLLACAVLVGLAFNTKTLAAYLVLPGIALGYLLCAPGPVRRRVARLLVAAVMIGAVSFSWIAFVELTPASQRPFVGSSTNNSELGLTFDYNGLGRVEGETGGPGRTPVAQGGGLHIVPRAPARMPISARDISPPPTPTPSRYLPNGRLGSPIVFGEATGPLRLFEHGLNGQGAWLLPFALLGLVAFALLAFTDERALRTRRLAILLVFGGWLLVEVAVLSFSKGIVHPYYVSAVGPGAAVMIAAGAVAFTSFARRRDWGLVLLPCALVGCVVAQLVILHEQQYMRWFAPLLIALVLVGMALLAARRLAVSAIAVSLTALLIAPAVYATTTWLAPVEGTFPAAGPHEAIGVGKYGLVRPDVPLYRSLVRYVSNHHPGTRWALLTVASPTAAPLVLFGLRAASVAGYSGTDPALDGPQLARLVARHEARYVVLGGAYASRGGNLATKAVLRACRLVPPAFWHGPPPQSVYTLVLFDCAGRERQLSGQVAQPTPTLSPIRSPSTLRPRVSLTPVSAPRSIARRIS
jgi:4-amino-4-deoxy-L-arabinose transferase-like glycosyltransferase